MGLLDKVFSAVAGPIVGGIFGHEAEEQRGDDAARAAQISADQAERINQRNIELQREFAQMGVRWRVEDAKAAGLHPLYALNSGGAAFAPVTAMGAPIDTSGSGKALSDMGQNLSRAISAQMNDDQRAMTQAQLGAIQAATYRDYAQASYYESLAARERQPGTGGGPSFPTTENPVVPGASIVQTGEFVGPPDLRAFYDVQQPKAREIPSARSDDRSISPGAGPTWDEVNVRPGLKMVVPQGSSVAEAMESISESKILMLAWIGENVRRFGNSWLYEAAKEVPPLQQLSRLGSYAGMKLQDLAEEASRVFSPAWSELGHRASDWVRRARERKPAERVPKWPYTERR